MVTLSGMVIDVRDLHSEKQLPLITVILSGSTIDFSAVQYSKQDIPKEVTPSCIVIETRDLQLEKHALGIVVILPGISKEVIPHS